MPRRLTSRLATLVLVAAVAGLVASAMVGGPSAIANAAIKPLVAGLAASRDAVRVEIGPGSESRYVAREVLAGRGFNEAVGRTPDVAGAILLDAAGTILPEQSRIVVDLRTLQSDNANRDRYIQRMTLQTDQYPTADLVLTGATGLPLPLPSGGSASFELTGDLTVHGVTRPTTWHVSATFEGASVTATAVTDLLISDFGMEPPRAGPVLSIEDGIRLEIDVRATTVPVVAELAPE